MNVSFSSARYLTEHLSVCVLISNCQFQDLKFTSWAFVSPEGWFARIHFSLFLCWFLYLWIWRWSLFVGTKSLGTRRRCLCFGSWLFLVWLRRFHTTFRCFVGWGILRFRFRRLWQVDSICLQTNIAWLYRCSIWVQLNSRCCNSPSHRANPVRERNRYTHR